MSDTDGLHFWTEALGPWPTALSDALGSITVGGVRAELRTIEGRPPRVARLPAQSLLFTIRLLAQGSPVTLVVRRADAWTVLEWIAGESLGEDKGELSDPHRSLLNEMAARITESLQAAVAARSGAILAGAVEDMTDGPTPGGLGDDAHLVALALRREEREVVLYLVLPVDIAGALSRVPPNAGPPRPSPFPQLQPKSAPAPSQNLDVLLDVPLRMVVVLGRSEIPLRDLLAVGPGSIVELDKRSGEPLEIQVNGKLVGHGEVVVVEDRFAIKVLDVVDAQILKRAG